MDEAEDNGRDGIRSGWFAAFLRELVTMPRRHIAVFVVATILLVLLEVELTEGWHLTHILEVLGGVLLVYLVWGAWRSRRTNQANQKRHSLEEKT